MTTALADQGCQTRARKAKFFVTALGELSRGRHDLPCSTINLAEVARANGLDWSKVCLYDRDDASPEAQEWNRLVKEYSDKQLQNELTVTEYNFAQKVYAFQDAADEGRFRVYGEMRKDGSECIVLVTEFMDFVDNTAFWERLAGVVAELEAHYWVMSEDPHEDRHYPARDDNDREIDELVRGRNDGAKWFVGPDHGRIERQVELSWRIEGMTVDQMKALQERVTATTDAFWSTQGVGVI